MENIVVNYIHPYYHRIVFLNFRKSSRLEKTDELVDASFINL